MTYTDLYTIFYKDEVERVLAARAFIRSHFLAALPDDKRGQADTMFAEYGSTSEAERKEVEEALAKKYRDFADVLYLHETADSENVLRCFYDLPELTIDKVLPGLEKQNKRLAEELAQRVFTINDLPILDDRATQKMLREIDQTDMAKALLKTDKKVQDKIFKNMSKRAASMLQNDMAALNVSDAEIGAAQKILAKIVVRLENQGEIVIARTPEDVLV